MRDKYKIVMLVDGIDLFHTVMKVVENNKGITVVNRELMPDEEPKHRRNIGKGNGARSAKSAPVLFMAYAEKTFKDETFTRDQIGEWMAGAGFSSGSSSPVASMLVREGKLIKVAQNTYRLP